MADFPGNIYAPPGVYTRTLFQSPVGGVLAGVRIPVIVGTGNELLQQQDLEVIRGSSSSVDQQVPQEDMTGRAVVSISPMGQVTLGAFNGARRQVQVRNFPITNGEGSGTVATDPSSIFVTINGRPDVVLSVSQADKGIIELSTAPKLDDDVRITYFFKRTDTQTTDDVSDQVTPAGAILNGAIGGDYEFLSTNNSLNLQVDGDPNQQVNVTFPLGVAITPATVVSVINGAAAGTSLVALTYMNNFGETAIRLTADRDVEILDGTANVVLGFTQGQSTSRNRTFYTFNGPIVDGTNGGVTTTDTSKVTVLVNGTQVIPTEVDGQNRAVVLPFAPGNTETVTIQYFFNTWQDTFDYLANINVTDVLRAGIVPGNNDFIQGADFVLKDDLIVWGGSFLVSPGVTSPGAPAFGPTQINGLLVDNRWFLAPATPVVDDAVLPPDENRRDWLLPAQPTTGNGRDTPLGQDVFLSISNGRTDLPTNNPNLVKAYWGFSLQDALQRGPVAVTEVNGATITLEQPVPVGASLWATFWYNTLVDETYTAEVQTSGPSGIGTYFLFDSDGNSVFTPTFGTKGAALTGVTVQFPSGSELTSDVRFEGGTQGPVEETVTVQFSAKDATIAKYTVPGAGSYSFVNSESDRALLTVDSAALAGGAAGIDLSSPHGVAGLGFNASLLGEEIEYTDDSGKTTYDIVAGLNDNVSVEVDEVVISALAAAGTGVSVDNYVLALNQFSKLPENAPTYTAATRFLGDTVITAGEYDELQFHYTGSSTGASGVLTATVAAATYNSPSALATAVGAAMTAAIGVAGLSVGVTANANGQLDFALTAADADRGVAATASIEVTGGVAVGEQIIFTDPRDGSQIALVAADNTTSGQRNFDVVTSMAPNDIATEIEAAIADPANGLDGLVSSALAVPFVNLTAAFRGTLGNQIGLTTDSTNITIVAFAGGTDEAGGFLEFVDGTTVAQDFASLAGISTDAAPQGAQTKLLHGDIARRFTVAGASGRLIYDRVVLRNRLLPGSGSLSPESQVAQTNLLVQGTNASSETGLVSLANGDAGIGAVLQEASLAGVVGFKDGQVATGTYGDARDGQPIVEFFADGNLDPQNNVFKFNIDGTSVTVVFTDAAGAAIGTGTSAEVPLGPIGSADTVLAQIEAACVAAGLAANTCVLQEGAGIRLRSAVVDTTSAVTIDNGNANTALGFSADATSLRSDVSVEQTASALMMHHSATIADALLMYDSPTATYFAAQALAGKETDSTNAEFLFLQSQANNITGLGPSSNIVVQDPVNDSWLLTGTGLNAVNGEGAAGEAGFQGFFVTSSDPVNGSGSADTSCLNNGVGQDGLIGQTYRDTVTGLVFTVLEREGGVSYPVGAGASFTFQVRKLVTTNANIPVNSIPGLELTVANTEGSLIPTGDTAIIETFDRGGNEPMVGDSYFVTYNYSKTESDFETQLFTNQRAVERNYGDINPDNPVSLAAFLMFLNGAVVVGIKQVPKIPGSNQASTATYIDALNDLRGPLPGGTVLDTITPLKGDDTDLFLQLSAHCDIQSSIRFRSERTAIIGVSSGTQPSDVGGIAQQIQNTRMRLVYPDIVTLTIQDALGNDKQFLVDGTFLAAAVAGDRARPNIDVATPWTRARIVGFDQLARTLDAVEQNQVAVQGVTVLDQRGSVIRIRQGLTTDMSNILTKLPTVITIADQVQRSARRDLDRFIGVKFLPGVLAQIEGQLSTTLKALKNAEIIAAFTGIQARTTADPTIVEIEAFYQPVFPLLYIVITFNLRSNLGG
jgi:hypothetical protein